MSSIIAKTSSKPNPSCEAKRNGDQFFCFNCGVTYDHDDKSPPICNPNRLPLSDLVEKKRQDLIGKHYLKKILSEIK